MPGEFPGPDPLETGIQTLDPAQEGQAVVEQGVPAVDATVDQGPRVPDALPLPAAGPLREAEHVTSRGAGAEARAEIVQRNIRRGRGLGSTATGAGWNRAS